MEGRRERVEPLDCAHDLSSLGGEVEAVTRGDRSMQQCPPGPNQIMLTRIPDQPDLARPYWTVEAEDGQSSPKQPPCSLLGRPPWVKIGLVAR